ncbi:MAG: hypothetical protein ACI4XC_01170 [Eubacterium sp.]
MKYFIRVIVVLLIASGIVFGYSYHYRQQKIADNIVLTTADMNAKKEKTTTAERKLIAQNKEGNYQLYTDGADVVLVHDGVEKVFQNWAADAKQETPQLFYKDYDGDGENELLIKIINGVVNTNGKNISVYNLYLVKPVEKNGKSDFSIISATKDTWKVPFEEAIKTEMTQLKSCDKFIQFVMDDSDVSFVYDKETGITRNKYYGFARALRKSDGTYEKLERWNKGNGLYKVDSKGNITLDIQLFAYYKGVESPQYVGDIHSKIAIMNGKFNIVPNTIEFVVNNEYKIMPPTRASGEKWKMTIINSAQPTIRTDDDMVIDWVEASFDLNSDLDEETISFANYSSQIKCIDKIEITPSSITMTAKEGYTFSELMLKNAQYCVKIHPGTDYEYNIEYTGEIKTVKERSVLKIDFERAFDKGELMGMTVKFGA